MPRSGTTTPEMKEQLDLLQSTAQTQNNPESARAMKAKNGRHFLVMSATVPVAGSLKSTLYKSQLMFPNRRYLLGELPAQAWERAFCFASNRVPVYSRKLQFASRKLFAEA